MAKLPSHAGVGGYDIIYVGDGTVLCPDCANKESKAEQAKLQPQTHWEGDSLYCDECSTELESAYGDPNA